MTRRALFLANTKARRGAELADQGAALLRERGFELFIPPPGGRETLCKHIEHHAAEIDRVIVLGGDGTINAVLPGLLTTGLPLGIIPGGTANDLAATLELPTDVSAAVDVIAGNHLRGVDLSTVNDLPFINAASMGLSVTITRTLDQPLKKRWGSFAYVIAATKALWRARAFSVAINTGADRVHLRTVQLVVGNGKYFGTGMTIDQHARIDDATMHLYSVGVYRWWSLLALAPSLRRGTHRVKKSVYNADGAHFTIETHTPRPISADGEILSRTPATFRVLPAAINVYSNPPQVQQT